MTGGPAGARLTVEASRYRAWRQAAPGLAARARADDRPEAMPPFVAAAFAVHVQAEASVSLRMTGSGLRVSVHVSRADALAAGVALVRFGSGDEWVQVALVPGEQAADEVVRWVPGAPPDLPTDLPTDLPMDLPMDLTMDLPGDPARLVPDGARLRIVALAGDLVRWQGRNGGWVDDRGGLADPARLRALVEPTFDEPSIDRRPVAQP